jgi:magnesium transporter
MGEIFMYFVSNFYLSRIIGTRIYSSNDNRSIGRIADLAVELGFSHPKVIALKLRDGRTLDFSHIDIVKVGKQYSFFCSEIKEIEINSEDIVYLAKNIQDKQIVDMDGRKVVRVNDIRLAVVKDGTYLIAVDVGLEGLLRRLSIAKPFNLLLKIFNTSLPGRLILWDDVQAVDVGHSGIKLSKKYSRISALHPSDIADIIEDLDTNSRSAVFATLDEEQAADVLEEMEPEAQQHIIDSLSIERAADVLEKMPSDEVADILDELEDDIAEEILKEMNKEASQEVRDLMEYPDGTVGSVMSNDFVTFNSFMKVGEVLEILRDTKPEMDTIFYLYVVNSHDRLIATVSLRDLVVSPFDAKLSAIMNSNFIFVHDNDKIDELVGIVSKYSLLAVPVVDEDNAMQGIVVINDVVYSLLRNRRKRL